MTESQQRIIEETATFVQLELQGAEAGHDWFHIQRVWKNARNLLQSEPADPFIVQLGALLHDIADAKFHDGNEDIGPAKTRAYLESHNIGEEVIDHVVNIVRHISFKGGHSVKSFHSAELSVVQDADRLDALGAIGIARAFHFGGFKNREIYNPGKPPVLHMDTEAYRKNTGPTINHFYEKLLLLKDRMNTPTGKSLAEERHLFMESFLQQFYHEWEGQK
ncbi:MAG: HD domain-containing protein [Ferruginibacter sp.]